MIKPSDWRDWRDWRLRLVAALLLTSIRLALIMVPYRKLAIILPKAHRPPPLVFARRIETTLLRVSRWMPWSTCLAEACTARTLLAVRGFGATMRIGVRPITGGGFIAHAWLISEGRVILGARVPDFQAFRDLADFPS